MKNLYLKSLFLSIPLLIFSGCSSENFSSSEKYDSKIKLSELSVYEENEEVDFEKVKASKTMKISLENNSDDDFVLDLDVSGTGFGIQRTDCSDTIPAHKSCSVSVILNARGTFQDHSLSGSLLLGNDKSVALLGESDTGKFDTATTGDPNLEIRGEYPSLGTPITNIYVKNTGDGNAYVKDLSIDSSYSVRLNHCYEITLSPNKECRIQLMLNRDQRTGTPPEINLSLNYKDNSEEDKVLTSGEVLTSETLPFVFVVRSLDSGKGYRKVNLNIKGVGGEDLVLRIDDNETTTDNGTFDTLSLEDVKIEVLSEFERKNTSQSISGNNNLVDVLQFGNIPFPENSSRFFSNEPLIEEFTAKDNPNLKNVTNMSYMFHSASNFNHDIGDWDTSNVTDMSYMFLYASKFNNGCEVDNIGCKKNLNWNTSNVINMKYIFASASNFNQYIGDWNTSNVTDMDGMFYQASNFNQDIGDWDTSIVTIMTYMFYQASNFNQDLSRWCIPKIGSNPTGFSSVTTSWESDNKPIFGEESLACQDQD